MASTSRWATRRTVTKWRPRYGNQPLLELHKQEGPTSARPAGAGTRWDRGDGGQISKTGVPVRCAVGAVSVPCVVVARGLVCGPFSFRVCLLRCVRLCQKVPAGRVRRGISRWHTVPDKVPLLACVHLPQPPFPQPLLVADAAFCHSWLLEEVAEGTGPVPCAGGASSHALGWWRSGLTLTERFYFPAGTWCLCFPESCFVFIDGVLVTFKFHVLEPKNYTESTNDWENNNWNSSVNF